MLDRMLPLFGRYYSPRQQLSLDEGMIPNKNHLVIKLYIRDIKSFLLLQLCHTLPPAEERAGSPGRGHGHAKPQALPQGTRQEADRTWPVQIPVPGSSVCHRLERPQAHPLPEQLPRPKESVHCEQAGGGPARAVDHATACGGLHQVS